MFVTWRIHHQEKMFIGMAYISLTSLLQLCRLCKYFFTAVSSLVRDSPQAANSFLVQTKALSKLWGPRQPLSYAFPLQPSESRSQLDRINLVCSLFEAQEFTRVIGIVILKDKRWKQDDPRPLGLIKKKWRFFPLFRINDINLNAGTHGDQFQE